MRSRSSRRTAATVAAVLALAGAGSSPAAAHPHSLDHVNLGDSFSAAIGTGGIVPTTHLGRACLQGDGPDHVSALDAQPRVTLRLNAACAGDTTDDIRTTVGLEPVHRALRGAELVTLTLGGNDVGWTRYLAACSAHGEATMPPGTCDGLIAVAPGAIERAAESAADTVDAIDDVTRGRILVLGYPRLFDEGAPTPLITPARATALNELTDDLNEALREAAEDEGAEFVDVSDRFTGHGVNSADRWIHLDPANPQDPNNFHPTEEGYLEGYYEALQDRVHWAHANRGHSVPRH